MKIKKINVLSLKIIEKIRLISCNGKIRRPWTSSIKAMAIYIDFAWYIRYDLTWDEQYIYVVSSMRSYAIV